MGYLLLADDEESNRDMISRRLAKRGYEVVTAVDGIEAYRTAAESPPDLILMDMRMPVLDGYEATRRIRQVPGLSMIPIIGLTADVMTGARELVLEAGCDDYEPKPVDFTSLLEKISRLLRKADGL